MSGNKKTNNATTKKEQEMNLQDVLSLLSAMREENAKVLSAMQEENKKLKTEIEELKKEQLEETTEIKVAPVSTNTTSRTDELLAKLANKKSDREVTIVHNAEMFGGMSTYIKLSTMKINFTRLGEERTLSWQQFEELCNTYRNFIDRGLIKVTPAQRDLCSVYQIGCYENGDPTTLTSDILNKLPNFTEKELEDCYNQLVETDKTILLNYWLGKCYARPEERDDRFYNRYKIELLNRLSNSSVFDNIIADMNFGEARNK